jgi:hypothetical protein
MIRHKLFIATATIATGVITACSDITAPTDMQTQKFAERPLFAEGSRPCVAPGGGFPGALNMMHDPTMLTVPMVRDAPQGNAGMFRAVAVSAC